MELVFQDHECILHIEVIKTETEVYSYYKPFKMMILAVMSSCISVVAVTNRNKIFNSNRQWRDAGVGIAGCICVKQSAYRTSREQICLMYSVLFAV